MTAFHIAQFNIVKLKAPLDDPAMAGFTGRLDEIGILADNSPGFVWRLQTEEDDSPVMREFEEAGILVNMSVWKSLALLHHYVYKSMHRELLRDKQLWADKMTEAHMVLWWISAGEIPRLAEAKRRLDRLNASGPGPEAFTFTKPFPPPGSDVH